MSQSISDYTKSNNLIIFSEFPSEINYTIALNVDDDWKFALSGINKCASKVFSNKFFEMLFDEKHPYFKGKTIFVNLQKYCPNSCWKIAFTRFPKGFSSQIFGGKQTIIDDLHPKIKEALIERKKNCEIELQQLCGSFYEDPASSLHQAWVAKSSANSLDQQLLTIEAGKAYTAVRLECERGMLEKAKEIKELLLQIHSEEELPQIFKIILENKERVLNGEFDEESFQPMIKCHLPTFYQPFAQFLISSTKEQDVLVTSGNAYLQQIDKLKEIRDLESNYQELESKRISLEYYLCSTKSKMDSFNDKDSYELLMKHEVIKPIEAEFQYAKREVELACTLSILQNCFKCIYQITSQVCEPTPSALEQIAGLINSCDRYCAYSSLDSAASYSWMPDNLDMKTGIWEALYQRCAGGVIEDRWSEIHFHEHLPVLEEMITSLIMTGQFLQGDIRRAINNNNLLFLS